MLGQSGLRQGKKKRTNQEAIFFKVKMSFFSHKKGSQSAFFSH